MINLIQEECRKSGKVIEESVWLGDKIPIYVMFLFNRVAVIKLLPIHTFQIDSNPSWIVFYKIEALCTACESPTENALLDFNAYNRMPCNYIFFTAVEISNLG